MSDWLPEEARAWRRGFGPDEVIQRIRPEPTFEYLDNPHKGCATFQRFAGDKPYRGSQWDDRGGPMQFPPPFYADLSCPDYPPARVSYCRWLWAMLEPSPGRYRWDILDKALATAGDRNQTLQVRVMPYIRGDMPSWYCGTRTREGTPSGGQKGLASDPDENDSRYLEHFGRFIGAMGKRFDAHPQLESVDVAFSGPCGEGDGNASADTSRAFVDLYKESFTTTELVSMLGTPGCAYAAKFADKPFGYRFDCFGDLRRDGKGIVPDGLCFNHMYDAYPQQVAEDGVADAWRSAPVTLETCWSVPYWRAKGWDISWILEHGLKYHPTIFMPKSCRIPEEWMGEVMEFCKRLGYWYFLQQLILPLKTCPGKTEECQVVLDNKGVAPIYHCYEFALRFSQEKRHYVVKLPTDVTQWMCDYTFLRMAFEVPNELCPGIARVSCALIDKKGKPRVRLAIKECGADGWHPLSWITIDG